MCVTRHKCGRGAAACQAQMKEFTCEVEACKGQDFVCSQCESNDGRPQMAQGVYRNRGP
jgi:hypothetical protein